MCQSKCVNHCVKPQDLSFGRKGHCVSSVRDAFAGLDHCKTCWFASDETVKLRYRFGRIGSKSHDRMLTRARAFTHTPRYTYSHTHVRTHGQTNTCKQKKTHTQTNGHLMDTQISYKIIRFVSISTHVQMSTTAIGVLCIICVCRIR